MEKDTIDFKDTLRNIQEYDVLFAIISKLYKSSNIKIRKFEDRSITVKSNISIITISWEMCSCHGGRMWLDEYHTNIHIELSSPQYDESKGIIDPESELAYYIEYEMIPTIESLAKYIYVSEEIGKWVDDKNNTRYYKSPEDAGYSCFSVQGVDPFSADEVTYQPPNRNRKSVYRFREVDKDGKYVFEAVDYERKSEEENWDISNNYILKFWMYRK